MDDPYKLKPIDINERFEDLCENRYPNYERVFNSIHKSGKMRITSVEDFLKGPFAAMKEELKGRRNHRLETTSPKRVKLVLLPPRARRQKTCQTSSLSDISEDSRCACPHASRCSFGGSSCLSGMELSRRRSPRRLLRKFSEAILVIRGLRQRCPTTCLKHLSV